METRVKLAKEQYAFNRDNETHLLVELSAPRVEIDEKRAPICLVPVLDVSGSMAGHKIDYVRKACRKLMDHLAPGDFAGLVAFDSSVYEVAPIREITQEQKENIKASIAKLEAGSCTNLSGGLSKALEWINAMDLPTNTIMRVIVFTDGHANVGIAGRNLLDFSLELKQKATISTFGFGNDCDQELLADISSRCGGNYAFIDSADSAMSAFGTELGGLMTTYGQDIKVTLRPDKNNQILEILNDEDVVDEDGTITVNLRDILGEEKKWVVARVKLSEVSKVLPRSVTAFKISADFLDKDGKKQQIEEFPVKVKFCKPCDEPIQEDSEVVKHRDRLLAAKAQTQAEQYARAGNYKMAQQVMVDCCDSLADVDTKNLATSLSASYSSNSSYTADRGVTNSVRSLLNNKRISHTSERTKKLADSAGQQKYGVLSHFVDSFTKDDWEDETSSKIEAQSKTDISTIQDGEDTKSKKRSNYDW